jgi:hypothetical protein
MVVDFPIMSNVNAAIPDFRTNQDARIGRILTDAAYGSSHERVGSVWVECRIALPTYGAGRRRPFPKRIVGYRSEADCSACVLDSNPVVHGRGDALSAAEVALGRLY